MAPDFSEKLAGLAPFVTVDAAGPFQAYDTDGHKIVRAALDCGSHYLDLSDDAAFTKGIAVFDEEAAGKGLTALSGVSSVPALSSAAVESLRGDFSRLDLIESMILPGNRAPRGLSVIRAILSQTGKAVVMFRDGAPARVPGWSGLVRRRIGPPNDQGLPPRWSSFIGAPDLELFPDHFRARAVLFRAGLELPVMHLGLWLLSWLVRWRLIGSLEPAAKLLQTIAGWLEPFGSDRGGMEVRVAGLDKQGLPLCRRWTLIAEAGDGPHIPAVAAAILCRQLSKDAVTPGARPCLGEFGLDDVKAATAHLKVQTFCESEQQPTLFQKALGPEFSHLPEPVRALHTVFDYRRWSGEASVRRGRSRFGNLLCRIIGFPPEAERTPVTVTIERRGGKEVWLRNFGGRTFRSVLSLRDTKGQGHIRERFGQMRFDIDLVREGASLYYPVSRGTFASLPLPLWLLPVSEASEYEENGRFHFDVKISFPGLGTLVHYRGWLQPEQASRAT